MMSKYHPLFCVALFCLLLPGRATAQDKEENLFWKSVICEQREEVALYLELYPQGAYVNQARACHKIAVAEAQRKAQAAQKLARQRVKWVGKMVAIPAGRFRMGDVSGDGGEDAKPVHTVRISSFEMGAHEVTVGQFSAFVADSGYAAGNCQTVEDGKLKERPGSSWRSPGLAQGDSHPVKCVSYEAAQAFIGWLNKKTGGYYRLPTEAEWEYAARAGTTSKFSWGNSESQAGAYAWYKDNWGDRFHAVGGKQANPWGLYDMHGNVWEWVADWYAADYYASSPVTDPQGPRSGGRYSRRRVLRGGSLYVNPWNLRSAYRGGYAPAFRYRVLGVRLVQDLTP